MLTSDEIQIINKFLDGLFKDDPSKTTSQQTERLQDVLEYVVDYIANMENVYKDNCDNLSMRVKDLEHIVVFSGLAEKENRQMEDVLNSSEIPLEFQGLSHAEYLNLLGETLQRRRKNKDFSAICRVCKERLNTVKNFISGMEKRMYSMRSFQDDEDDVVETEEIDTPPVVSTRPKYNDYTKKLQSRQIFHHSKDNN